MPHRCRTLLTICSLLVVVTAARAEDLRAAMEAANMQFLKAFNTPDPAGFLPLYTADAVLLFAGAPPIRGPEAITRFWESRIRAGARAHTFELIETGADGKYAYQLSRAGVQLIRDSGERTPISGYTVRVFEIRATAAGKQRSTCSIGRTCRSRKLLNAASDGGKPCQDTQPNSLRLPCSGS